MTISHYQGSRLGTEDDIPWPRTAAVIQLLTSEYGAEYTLVLSRAVQDADRGDHASYLLGRDAAMDALAETAGDHSSRETLVDSHIGVFITEIGADIARASHSGVRPPLRRRGIADRGRFDYDRC